MDNSIRVSARTVDEAITEASIQLAVTSDQLEYEIIEKGRDGFLGIGAKQAVIEVRRKGEPAHEEIREKRGTKRGPKADRKPIYKKPPEKEANRQERRKKEDSVRKEEKIKTESEEKKVKETAPAANPAAESAGITEEIKKNIETFLKGTLSAMGISAELVTETDKEGAVCVDIKGENMGILIGKRGQTLDALQYLANRVANRHQEGYIRVKLDTENYRSRREETLKKLAKNIAYKVKRTRKPIYLEPMNPYERRIIHSALQSDSRILTHSEGEEPYRKVVITLKK